MATAVSTLLAGIGSGRLTGTSKHYFRASCPTVPHGGHTDASTSHRGSWLAAHTARPEPSPLCHTPPAAPLMPCQMQNSHMKGGAVTATRKLPAKHIQYCYGGPSLQPAHRLRRALTHAHTAVCTPLSGALLMCPSWPIWVCGGQVCQPTLHNGTGASTHCGHNSARPAARNKCPVRIQTQCTAQSPHGCVDTQLLACGPVCRQQQRYRQAHSHNANEGHAAAGTPLETCQHPADSSSSSTKPSTS